MSQRTTASGMYVEEVRLDPRTTSVVAARGVTRDEHPNSGAALIALCKVAA